MKSKFKNIAPVIIRLGRVLYVTILIVGLFGSLYEGLKTFPNNEHEVVHCRNGKSFDPASKPLERNSYYNSDIRERGIASECQFGTVYLIASPDLDLNNNTIEKYKTPFAIDDWKKVVLTFLINISAVILLVEVSRRTLRYVVWGKHFFKNG